VTFEGFAFVALLALLVLPVVVFLDPGEPYAL